MLHLGGQGVDFPGVEQEFAVGVGVDVVFGLEIVEVARGGAVTLAGVLEPALARVDDLRLAVGHDQGVFGLVFQGKDLAVEGAAVKSCDRHVSLRSLGVASLTGRGGYQCVGKPRLI